MPFAALQHDVYIVISYFPYATSQQPLCWSTEPMIWKNWLTLSFSSSPEMEFNLVKATFTNLDWLERSPGIPIPPMPLL